MTSLVFIDTETTSLRPDRRAWEIGLIVRRDDGDVEDAFLINDDDLDLGNADLMSLRVGRFHDRHPRYNHDTSITLWSEGDALEEVERLTRGAHLVGAVPNFDAEVLAARMRAHGICPSWHYHPIDVEALMVGYLAGRLEPADPGIPLPWKSDDLAARCGVRPLADEDRHTALGDARWARDIYDAVMGGAR